MSLLLASTSTVGDRGTRLSQAEYVVINAETFLGPPSTLSTVFLRQLTMIGRVPPEVSTVTRATTELKV